MRDRGSSRFQPGEGPSRGLLRDCEPSDGTFSSTSVQVAVYRWLCTGVQVYNRWPPEPHRDRTFMASLVQLISHGEVSDYRWKSEVVSRQRDDAYRITSTLPYQ